MSKLSRDDVLKLARLSRLKLTDSEIEKFQNELSEILTYVEVLDKVDTANLQPTYQLSGLVNVSRPDEPKTYQAKPGDLIAQAEVKDGHFKVKRVL